ncbi:hypothetical protein BASA62_006889 [Batrachochytrium salamandrivorans]|nr:hypothetical protein BASA62_006889 [Batrachochytrium salamandrivorans]
MTVLISNSKHHPTVNTHTFSIDEDAAVGTGGIHRCLSNLAHKVSPPQQESHKSVGLGSILSNHLISIPDLSSTAVYAPIALKKSDSSYAKHSSRIQSLERTIEYMQSQHSSMLTQLHEEIERLQTLATDAVMKSVVTEEQGETHRWKKSALGGFAIGLDLISSNARQPASFFQSKEGSATSKQGVEIKSRDMSNDIIRISQRMGSDLIDMVQDWASQDFDTRSLSKEAIAEAQAVKKSMRPNGSNNETTLEDSSDCNAGGPNESSIYILVNRERRKFQCVIERMNDESKRKQVEINRMRHEMEVVCGVLKLAGLKFDVKEFQNILQSHKFKQKNQQTTAIQLPIDFKMDIKSKISVLPPISKKDKQKRKENLHESVSNHQLCPLTQGEASGTVISPPTEEGPKNVSSRIRAIRYRSNPLFSSAPIVNANDAQRQDTMVKATHSTDVKIVSGTPDQETRTIEAMEMDREATEMDDDQVSAQYPLNKNMDYSDCAHSSYGENVHSIYNENIPEENRVAEVLNSDDLYSKVSLGLVRTTEVIQDPLRHVRIPSDSTSVIPRGDALHDESSKKMDMPMTIDATLFISEGKPQEEDSHLSSHSSNASSQLVDDGERSSVRQFSSYSSNNHAISHPQKIPEKSHTVGYVGRLIKSRLVRDKQSRDAQSRAM